jgi:hypothetical protein
MAMSIEIAKELDALFDERAKCQTDKFRAFQVLNSLIQSFGDNPTEATGKSVEIAMGTYAIAFNAYSIAAQEYDEAANASIEAS